MWYTLAENIVTSTSGSPIELKVESIGKAFKCVLETNRNEKLEYTPGFHRIREDIECIDKRNETCTFRINKANDTHAGVWKVTAYTAKKETEENVDLHDNITSKVFLFSLYIRQVNLASYIVVQRFCFLHCMWQTWRNFMKLIAASDTMYDWCFLHRFYNLLFLKKEEKST